MALLNIRKINPATLIGFWEITETKETLRVQLEKLAGTHLNIPEFTSATRQTQWLSSRILVYTLLQQFTGSCIPIKTNPDGKPFFEDELFQVSITHSHQQVAVILSSQYKVGIDIEIISPKVLRIADKFMAPLEKQAATGDLVKTLIYWSAKETLYKLYSKKQLIFKEHILIEPFPLDLNGTLNAQIYTPDFRETYTVYYEKQPEYILTYCVGEPNEII